jgi:hypothetical protein
MELPRCPICTNKQMAADVLKLLLAGNSIRKTGKLVGYGDISIWWHVAHFDDATREAIMAVRRTRKPRCKVCSDPAKAEIVLGRLLLGAGFNKTAERLGGCFGGTTILRHVNLCLPPDVRSRVKAASRASRAKNIAEGRKRLFAQLKQEKETIDADIDALSSEARELVTGSNAGKWRKN